MQSGAELQTFMVTLPAYGTAIYTISDSEEMVVVPEIPALLSVDDSAPVQIDKFKLYQNFPNPFNPTTTIRYHLADAGEVELHIYDINGRLVADLTRASSSPGYHEITWSGQSSTGLTVETGLYIARIRVGDYSEAVKMIYLK